MKYAAILGAAGTGKSHELRERSKDNPMYACLTATTGIAAINLGAGVTTINSVLRYYNTESLKEALDEGDLMRSFITLARAGFEWLLIDEVSMMCADQITYICQAAEAAENHLRNQRMTDLTVPGLMVSGDFCFGQGTVVTMFDGSLKAVEHLVKGDLVMGPDSKPRKVLKLCSGTDDLYEVQQTNGSTYVVNSKHLLELQRGINGRSVNERWLRYPSYEHSVRITAPELMNMSLKFRECFVGFRAGVITFNETCKLPVDPYFLGTWLGDGNSDDLRVTTPEPELIEYYKQFASSCGLEAKVDPKRRGAYRVAISSGRYGGVKRNPVLTAMQDMHLIDNKHIPHAYLTASVSDRLKLLAGLLDTDGTWSGNRYTITLVGDLALQVKQLADHLGFRTGLRKVKSAYYTPDGKRGTCWGVSIGGDTWRVPCIVTRKQSTKRELNRSRMTSVLTVKPVGHGKYFGFELDGDHLFILADGTVAHNCQLPPVQGEFAFRSPFWHNFEKENSMTRLTHNYRQDNPVFQQALAFARHGNGVDCAMQLKKLSMEMNPKVNEDFQGVTLFPTNVCVDKMNKSRFDKLPGDVEQFAATRWGVLAQEWKQIPHVLDLKVDARVMVLTNDPGKFEYVNGDQAIVRYFTDTAVGLETDRGVHLELPYLRRTVLSKTKPANAKEFGGVRIEGATFHTLRECSTPREKAVLLEASEGYAWNNFFDQTPYLDVRSGKWVVGEIAYMPLRLGYASTFHKVQGLTLDSVQIDARMNWAGNPAMMYVALSRCRTPEHVRIVTKGLGDLARRIVTSGEVMKWV